MSYVVHLICDYSPGDLAWAEVYSVFASKLPADTRMHMMAVASFDTVSTGFAVGQLARAGTDLRPENVLIFANCAPRKDRKDPRQNNEGEGLLFGSLKNGVNILAVNSGYSLSFVRQEILELWGTHAEDKGSQFRSRDFFPNVVGLAVSGDYSFLNHKLDAESLIPDEPKEAIGYVDSFGNLKTTFREGDGVVDRLQEGARIKVTIGSMTRAATVATGSFNVMEGDLAFAPGSSGHDRRYWELFKRGGSAWDEFFHPMPGSKIRIDLA